MRALVTGATGFIGPRLVERLERPVVLSRNPQRASAELNGIEAHGWDAEAGPPPADALQGVEAVFHLAGDPVAAGRWTAAKKQRIRDSRVVGTRNMVQALAQLDAKPKVLVCASAVGIYGSRGDKELDESATPGDDFLADVCCAWEAEAQEAAKHGIRVANLRIGIVLGRGGGALSKMLTPFRLGLGGRLGDGKQWMPWVHVDDIAGLLLHAAAHDEIHGPINGVAPSPVTNREFTRILAAVLHRPAILPAPAFALRLALGEMSDLLLASQRVVPRVAQETGYEYRYTDLAAALKASV